MAGNNRNNHPEPTLTLETDKTKTGDLTSPCQVWAPCPPVLCVKGRYATRKRLTQLLCVAGKALCHFLHNSGGFLNDSAVNSEARLRYSAFSRWSQSCVMILAEQSAPCFITPVNFHVLRTTRDWLWYVQTPAKTAWMWTANVHFGGSWHLRGITYIVHTSHVIEERRGVHSGFILLTHQLTCCNACIFGVPCMQHYSNRVEKCRFQRCATIVAQRWRKTKTWFSHG